MPQGLPQYDEPQVKPAPIPGAMAKADAPLASFGGGDQAFNAAEGLADDASKVFQAKAEKGRQMAVDSEVYGAAAQLSSMQAKLMNDARAQQGRNAFGVYNPTMDSFKQGADQIASQLQTPEAKASYQRLVFEHQAQLDKGLQDHIFTQRQEDTKQTIAAASEQFENAAVSTAISDPRATQFNLRMAKAADGDLAKNAGLSDVSASLFLDQRQSARQLQILNAFLSADQDQAAEAYFKAYKDDFKGKDLTKAQELVIDGSARGRAMRAVDAVFSPSFGTVPADQGVGPAIIPGAQTLGEAQAKVREIQDQKVRAYAEQEVGRRWTQMQEDLQQQRVQTFNGLAKIAVQTGDINQVIRSNPDAYLNGITPAQRTELEAQARMVADRRDPVTDALLWYKYDQMARNPKTAAEFMDTDLTQFRSKISEKHFEGLSNLQGDLKAKSDNSIATLAFGQIVEDELLKENVFPPLDSMSNEQKRQYAAFRLAAADRFDTFRRKDLKGVGNPTQEQMQDIVQKMIRNKAQSNGILWNTTMPSAAVLPKDRIISNESRDDMTALIKGRGKEVSDDKLNRMNEAFQNGNRKLYLKIADE